MTRNPIAPRSSKVGGTPAGSALAEAEALAIDALRFLGGDPARMDRFLTLSGIEGAKLREAAARPGFLSGLMDYLMADEALLLAFASASRRPPQDLVEAHATLQRGGWTDGGEPQA